MERIICINTKLIPKIYSKVGTGMLQWYLPNIQRRNMFGACSSLITNTMTLF